ncbi:MAG: tetratricopeptide repeat protein [Deltaproteobacteria bacterium]|nr:tetratricopeptide repeat protein [Deltaproteobacteria bacterium]
MDKSYTEDSFLREECGRCFALLESSIVDGDEGAEEDRLFVERHLASCPECRAFQSAIDVFDQVPQISDSLAKNATDAYFERRRGRFFRPAVAFPVAAALAAAAAVLIMLNITEAPTTIPSGKSLSLKVAAGSPLLEGASVEVGTVLAEGQQLSTVGKTALVKADSTLTVALESKTHLALDSLREKSVELGLERGQVAVRLAPGNKMDLTVNALSARVIVTGTVFGVETLADDVRVSVVRGSVRVESSLQQGRFIDVAAGSMLLVKDWKKLPLETHTRRAILALLHLEDSDTRKPDDGEEVVAEEAVASPESVVPVDEADDAGDETASATRGSGTRVLRQNRRETKRVPSQVAPSMNELIRAARKCRSSRDWLCAAATYEKVIKNYPDRAESLTVLLPLAQIELEYLRRPAQALRHYSLYQKRLPSGPLAQEALYGMCKAFAAMGQTKREVSALEDFLKRYPHSVYASNARVRLQRLAKNK